MDMKKTWEELLGLIERPRDGLSITSKASGCDTKSEQKKLTVQIKKFEGSQIKTCLVFNQETGILTWQAHLLKGKKKRRCFFKKINKNGCMAVAFYQMTECLDLVHLTVNEEEGPVLHLAQYIEGGISEVFFEVMLREMMTGFIFKTKILETLTKGEKNSDISVSLSEMWSVSSEDNDKLYRMANKARLSAEGNEQKAERKYVNDPPSLVVAINTAIVKDQPDHARQLADIEDVHKAVPDSI